MDDNKNKTNAKEANDNKQEEINTAEFLEEIFAFCY